MLKNYEARFKEQSLRYMDSFELSGVRLIGYMHAGKSVSPAYYWCTEDGRLLIARDGLVTYVWTKEDSRYE